MVFSMKKKNKYIFQIMNKLAGDITPGDQKKLKVWLDADLKNKEEYELIAKIISEAQRMKFPVDPSVHEEWNVFEFPEEPLLKHKTFSSGWQALNERIASFLHLRQLAYIALIIGMIGAFAFWYYQSIHSIKTITTANSQHQEIKLSDGTRVYLNSGTELSFPERFTDTKRLVRLKGEAFFYIAKSKSQFIVQTSEGTVTVIGTRFNIWARNSQTRVIVEDGQVCLSANKNAGSVILTKDLMSEIYQNKPPSKPRMVNTKRLLGWRIGKLVFNRTMLSELAGEIGRYYDIDIAIENPELETKTITAVFDRLPLEKVLYSICLTLDIKQRYEHGLYILYKENAVDDQ
jgi:transmembrane sensor